MNNAIKMFLVFASGAGIGSLVTYRLVKEGYEQLVQAEIASVREVSDRNRGIRAEPKDDKIGAESKVLVMKKDQYKKIARNYNKVDIDDINHVPDQSEGPEEEPKEEEDGYNEWENRVYENTNKPPYIIGIEEFSEEMTNFDKETIYYFEEDDVLADSNEEVIADVNSIVGEEALSSFGDPQYSEDVVFVRNEKLAIDYEIIRLNKSYQRDVLGIDPNENKRSNKRRRAAHEE